MMNLMSWMMKKKLNQKVRFDTYRRGVYCYNCYNEGHFTKECKLLIKFCQICKNDNHNNHQCHNKSTGGRCPTKEIVSVHVVQIEPHVIHGNKQHNYEKFNNKKGYGNQSYNSRPNNQNWKGNRNKQQY